MAWLCAIVATTLALASPAADELDRGKTAFGRAEYVRAIDILRPLLYPEIRLDSEGDVVQAHRMLGVANLFGLSRRFGILTGGATAISINNGTTALQLAIANSGGFVATFIYPNAEKPQFHRGHTVVLGLLVGAWIL